MFENKEITEIILYFTNIMHIFNRSHWAEVLINQIAYGRRTVVHIILFIPVHFCIKLLLAFKIINNT